MKKEIIAVIGGIASGKSTVLSILEKEFSYKILGMDEIAKALYGEKTVLQGLKNLLPKEVFTEEGKLSFPELRTLLFTDPESKKSLENYIHPLVFQRVFEEIKRTRTSGGKLAVETALPNQSFLSECDLIFYLASSRKSRLGKV